MPEICQGKRLRTGAPALAIIRRVLGRLASSDEVVNGSLPARRKARRRKRINRYEWLRPGNIPGENALFNLPVPLTSPVGPWSLAKDMEARPPKPGFFSVAGQILGAGRAVANAMEETIGGGV
jgi:hypothetical protein